MDALPSAVSVITVMKEKTVSYMRCHSRGCEKVLWPIVCIVVLVVSIILLAVACGTQNWVQLEVLNNASQPRGNITFGLLRGSHRIQYNGSQIVNTINGSYYLFDRLPLIYLARLHSTFGLSLVAILLCLLNIAVSLLNSYQSVTTWWRGPSMMYLLSLFASVCALGAVGVFLDHFFWEMDTTLIFVRITELSPQNALTIGNLTLTSFEYLLTTRGYHSVPVLMFSFYVEIAGACLPLLVTLLSWRLALLIPPRKVTIEETSHISTTKHYPLKETNSLQFFSAAGNPNFGLQETPFDYDPAVAMPSEPTMSSSPMSSSPSTTPPPMPTRKISNLSHISQNEVTRKISNLSHISQNEVLY